MKGVTFLWKANKRVWDKKKKKSANRRLQPGLDGGWSARLANGEGEKRTFVPSLAIVYHFPNNGVEPLHPMLTLTEHKSSRINQRSLRCICRYLFVISYMFWPGSILYQDATSCCQLFSYWPCFSKCSIERNVTAVPKWLCSNAALMKGCKLAYVVIQNGIWHNGTMALFVVFHYFLKYL